MESPLIEYEYGASAADGKLIRGVIFAADKHDLSLQLQKQGLFLVSFSVVAKEESAADPVAVASVEPAVEVSRKEEPDTLSPAQRLWIILAIIVSISIGIWRANNRHHPQQTWYEPTVLNDKVAAVRKGMTREQLEKIFPDRYSRDKIPGITRYVVPPDFIVEIQYDHTGGEESPLNVSKDVPLRILMRSTVEQGKR